VGDGPWRKALEEQVSRLALEEKVHFLGYRGDVPDILGASDLFVLPSRYEAMPVVLLEAMAAGLPCVVTAVGDNSYLIEDGVTGRLVSPEDPTALAEVLEELISDPLRRGRMKAAARQKVQNFTSKNKINRIEWVYHEINEVNK
jgi:glycosyltransferase involved in cell wall biosynthesis